MKLSSQEVIVLSLGMSTLRELLSI